MIDRKQVKLGPQQKQDLSAQPTRNLNAVREIAKAEYQALEVNCAKLESNRLYSPRFCSFGDKDVSIYQLEYSPILNRFAGRLEQATPSRAIAVLTGSIVIIPTVAKPRLEELLERIDWTYQSRPLSPDDFLKVRLVGSQHDLVTAVTQLFQGLIRRHWNQVT